MADHNNFLSQAMQSAYRALFLDIRNLTGHDCDADWIRVRSILGSQGPFGLLAYLKKHETVLIDFLRTDRLSPVDVKCGPDGLPVFQRALWSDLTSVCDRVGCDHIDARCEKHGQRCRAYFCIKQTLVLFKKARVNVDPSAAFASFRDRMADRRVVLGGDCDAIGLIDACANVLKASIPDLKPGELRPYVSSGATFSHTRLLDRCEAVCQPWPHEHNGLDHIPSRETPPRNRAVAVPKDWTKPRIVFVESAERMLLQQSLRLWVEGAVLSSDLSSRIRFDDQGHQRQSLAAERRASIDLSDASDHLRSTVIWRFLRHHPILRRALFFARSSECQLPNGDTVPVRCYGTMGNATTFTIMSLFLVCLTAVCERDVLRWSSHKLRVRGSTVFGDDVVCDDFIAGRVGECLAKVGLKVNRSKTFVLARFRESCGLDLFEGENATPIAFKRFVPGSSEFELAWLSYSNQLHKSGFWQLAGVLFGCLSSRIPVNTTSDDTSAYSFSKGYDPRSARWFAPEQRFLGLAGRRTVRTLSRDNELQLSYALACSRLLEPVSRDRDSAL